MSARDLAVMLADFAGFNEAVDRSKAVYYAEQQGFVPCRRGHMRPIDGRCLTCDSSTRKRLYRLRKGKA